MRLFRSRRLCLSCDRLLPRAASRCPWCLASKVVPAELPRRPTASHPPAGRFAPPQVLP